jgi:Ca-activated chloride channel family protein
LRFLRPDLMELWLALPVLAAVWTIHFVYTRMVRSEAAIARRFKALSRRTTWIRNAAVLVLALIAGGALVFALVRPQALISQRTPEYDQQDLIIMLDHSISMRAHDISPTRFTRATLEIKNFLHQKPDAIGRVALVSFADEPVVLSYLTNDLEDIFFYLDWADDDVKPQYGTDVGAALNSAMEIAQKDKQPTKKIFLLISDGEDHGQELDAAVAKAHSQGYRIYCIGIGSEKEVPIPELDMEAKAAVAMAKLFQRTVPYGGKYLTDENGAIVETKFEESTLRSIAETTGGQYARSMTGKEMTQAIVNVVNRERRIASWKTSAGLSDLYPFSLALACVASAALWLLL